MSLDTWAQLGWQAWFTLGVVVFILALLVFTRIAPDVVLVAAVTMLLVGGVVTANQAFAGMSNEGMLTVAVLYVVVAGLDTTGATSVVVHRFLRRPRSTLSAIVGMMIPVAFVSAFLNNTPVVAMFLPVVKDWAKKNNISASKLMIPLSYAAVLGGCCTLIGTSTNLVVNGLLINSKLPGMNMFDVAWPGVPCAIAGFVFIVLTQRWLLPDRRPVISQTDDPKQYTLEMIVEPGSPLVGRTIEQAGLRHLPQVFLAEIDRRDQVLPAVSPNERLESGDRLVFVGVVESIVDLRKIRGLTPAPDQVFKLDAPRAQRVLTEAVVSDRCPVIGQTIRDGRFRTRYNAVVIAVARSGERIQKKIGDIVLQAGDTLLLEAPAAFAEQQRNSKHFYLVSNIADSNPPRHERAPIALAILLLLIVVASAEWLSMLEAGMLAAGAMIISRCCTSQVARRSVDWQVLIAIAASFAVGSALGTTGLAKAFAQELIALAQGNAWASLLVIYGVTVLLTELITNNAAAVLMFPIALQTAAGLGLEPMPFIIGLTLAASLGFATPLGYQTHLMVFGPGGYRFSDFLRIGIPLDILCGIVTVTVTPLAFPFQAVRG